MKYQQTIPSHKTYTSSVVLLEVNGLGSVGNCNLEWKPLIREHFTLVPCSPICVKLFEFESLSENNLYSPGMNRTFCQRIFHTLNKFEGNNRTWKSSTLLFDFHVPYIRRPQTETFKRHYN